ncbi:serine hydrolase domain-containing protein [Pedobacter panaciterrae]
MRTVLILILLLCQLPCTFAQSWADTISRIETIFKKYQPQNPGAQLAISRGGKLLFSKAWGMADLEQQTSLSTNSIIEAGSVSKQFTAAAILLLEQQGKLSLNDEVHKYLPELPTYSYPITLSQMIHHTSGLKDWGSLVALSDWPRGTKTYSNADVFYLMCHQHTLNHIPGEKYQYSNSNYVLLAIILQRITGQTLAEFTRDHIFQPAGMNHTTWRDDLKEIIPNRAMAYGKQDGHYFTDMPGESVYGNGGLLSTAEDLLKWNQYYLSGKLGNPSLLDRQLQTFPLNNGQKNNYASGLRVDSINGQPAITHDGATAAYRASLEHYPRQQLSIAWLSNTAEFDGQSDPLSQIRNLLLPQPQSVEKQNQANNNNQAPAKPKPAAFQIDTRSQKDYIGTFYSDEVDSKLSITIQQEKLILVRYIKTQYKLIPLEKDKFDIEGSKVQVSFQRKGSKVIALSFSTPKVSNVTFKKL